MITRETGVFSWQIKYHFVNGISLLESMALFSENELPNPIPWISQSHTLDLNESIWLGTDWHACSRTPQRGPLLEHFGNARQFQRGKMDKGTWFLVPNSPSRGHLLIFGKELVKRWRMCTIYKDILPPTLWKGNTRCRE